MKQFSFLIIGTLTLAASLLLTDFSEKNPDSSSKLEKTLPKEEKKLEPHDQWLTIRSYPNGFDREAYLESMEMVKRNATDNAENREINLTLDWLSEGPGNIGGRIDVILVHPESTEIMYAGCTNGGIFKTVDNGANWNPIFDDYPYLAIGALAFKTDDYNTIYAGTGDRNFSGNSFIGNGLYKTDNSGESWEHLGLENTGAITEVIVDPINPDRIFVSAIGNPHVKTTERGVYRTIDGGETWENVLFLSDSAGVVDLIMHPSNPDILYASGYNRMRNYFGSQVSGPEARIYKTTNGGDSWTMLENGLPLENESRIGLAISNENPNTLYALYVDGEILDVQDVYKTTDAGENWNALNVHSGTDPLPEAVMGGFGWYFGEIYMNPYNNDQLIIPGIEMFQSLDGGETWEQNVPDWWTYQVHADKHAIAFLDENSYIIATDGGMYRTDNNGDWWIDIEDIPITQFYHIAIDPHNFGSYAGGAQDNGTMSGNATMFDEWQRLFGGDGFRVVFLEEDEGAFYCETQNGGLRYISPSGDVELLYPEPTGGDRINWDMPYVVNEENAELFVGTSKIKQMIAAPYGIYEEISGDLTRIGMGEAWGNTRYHNITEIDQPKDNDNLLYVGTSDGLMWKGDRTAGTWNWLNITGDLPNHYITGVRCSPNEEGTVYVMFSGYKSNDDQSYLFKTDDFGETWQDISSDLPDITVNDLLIVPNVEADNYLFAAMDGGVYFSENNGASWDYVGEGLPFATVSELALDIPNRKLIAGTFARSMWSYDVSWIEELDDFGMASIAKNQDNNSLFVYPNPTQGLINIKINAQNEQSVFLYDELGKLILKQNIQNGITNAQIDLSDLKTGIFTLKVGNQTQTIIKTD